MGELANLRRSSRAALCLARRDGQGGYVKTREVAQTMAEPDPPTAGTPGRGVMCRAARGGGGRTPPRLRPRRGASLCAPRGTGTGPRPRCGRPSAAGRGGRCPDCRAARSGESPRTCRGARMRTSAPWRAAQAGKSARARGASSWPILKVPG